MADERSTENVRRMMEEARVAVERRKKQEADAWRHRPGDDKSRGKKLVGGGARYRMRRLQDGARAEIEMKYGSMEEYEKRELSNAAARAQKEEERLMQWIQKKTGRFWKPTVGRRTK